MTLADMFHATSMAEYDDIRARGFSQPISVIPNGVEIPELVTSQSDSQTRTLLYLSRIHPTKQVDLLLRVWSKLECGFPNWRLQIAGPLNNPYAQEMQRLSAGLGHERVSFSGELVGSEKWQAYREADLFVLPTKTENFGLAIAEALASGTPVVTTKGAPWSGLDKHRCGWWIDDVKRNLEGTLRHALALSQQVLREHGLRGRLWVSEEFGWPEVADKMAISYRWLTARGDRPSWIHLS